MFKNFFNLFSRDVGIDLGTNNVRIYVKGKGLVINEASAVALNTRSNQIITIGNAALKMLGKTPYHISVIKPLSHGIISDFEIAEKMLSFIIKKINLNGFSTLFRPRVVSIIPLDVTEVEKKSLEDVIFQAGAREVNLIQRPVAAAIGAKLPILDSIGNFIIEMGGGLSEVAVISLGGIVSWKSLKIGGNTLNKNIFNYVREKFGLLLGEQTIEEIKLKIGSACSLDKTTRAKEVKVQGRDLVKGLPREIIITAEEVREAIIPLLKIIVSSVSDTIENTPPELVADIRKRGLMLSGGSSLIPGLDKLIQEKIDIPVYMANDPMTSVIRGTGLTLEDFDNLKSVFVPSARD